VANNDHDDLLENFNIKCLSKTNIFCTIKNIFDLRVKLMVHSVAKSVDFDVFGTYIRFIENAACTFAFL
jgi:hypothetical protein